MKKAICILLLLAVITGLLACGGTPENKEEPATLSVGFGRTNITPEKAVFMTGYGDDITRLSKGVLDELFVTCIAITDNTGNTVMLITSDVLAADMQVQVRAAVVKATGVPFENIIYSGTHTHSGPKIGDRNASYLKKYYDFVAQAATQAMEDRAIATLKIGNSQVDNLSFVRHYNTVEGTVVGDNFFDKTLTITDHTTVADNLLQAIRFEREGKKPIVMVNWQGHPLIASTGSDEARANRALLSSDYIGPCRDYVEAEGDCLFAFFLSGSGNQDSYSRIPGEGTKDHRVYGKTLGAEVVKLFDNMVTLQPGTVSTTKKIQDVTSSKGTPAQIEFYAFAAGDISFVNVPFEMFDTTAMAIKNNTPYKMTFVITLSNGDLNYIPTQECWDYPGCYEVSSCYYERGTAELLEKAYIDTLNGLHG